MNYPASEENPEMGDPQNKKDYVKPVIEEGADLPTATALLTTPAILSQDA